MMQASHSAETATHTAKLNATYTATHQSVRAEVLGGLTPASLPRFLASVGNVAEAKQALAGGAEIIDIKDPAHGALGAASDADVMAIIQCVAAQGEQRRLVSATVGDLPLDAGQLVPVCAARAKTGVDIVKVGLIPGAARLACVTALGPLARQHPMIVVLFADREGDRLDELELLLRSLGSNGFLGVMIDTFDKRAGSLTAQWSPATTRGFVSSAHDCELLCGLAGSLSLADIADLAPMGADVLGFRGALCDGFRSEALQSSRVQLVSQAMHTARADLMGAAPHG